MLPQKDIDCACVKQEIFCNSQCNMTSVVVTHCIHTDPDMARNVQGETKEQVWM